MPTVDDDLYVVAIDPDIETVDATDSADFVVAMVDAPIVSGTVVEAEIYAIAIDPEELTVSDATEEPDVVVSLEGVPGPMGPEGPQGPKGDTGSIGDVTAIPPLDYDSNTNTISIDPDALGAKAFSFVQSSSSSTWTITHNLGHNPSVTIIDSANQTVYGDVHYDDINTVRIIFGTPFSGTAYLV